MCSSIEAVREQLKAANLSSNLSVVQPFVDTLNAFNEKSQKDLALCALCSHVGLMYNAEQVSFREQVANGPIAAALSEADKFLSQAATSFIEGAEPGTSDVALLHAVLPVLTTVLLPEQRRESYASLDAWSRRCLARNKTTRSHYLGAVRIGNQIDMFPNSKRVRTDADFARDLNAGYKKKATQRQLEKAAKAQKGFELPKAAETFGFSAEETVGEGVGVKEKIGCVKKALAKVTGGACIPEVVEHEATPDMETVARVLKGKTGFFCKNLFLKAKKPRKDVTGDSCIWLVCAPTEAKVNYPALTKQLGYVPKAELRQAKPAVLAETLKVAPGHVTPFGLMNDPECKVNVVLDKKMMADAKNELWFHPLTNEASLKITAKDLALFVAACARTAVLVDFEHEKQEATGDSEEPEVKVQEPLELPTAEAKERLWSYLTSLGCKPYGEKDVDLEAKRPVGHSTHNLFVKDKKSKRLFLIATRQSVNVDLKKIAKAVDGVKEFRMSSDMKSAFSVDSGCITLLSLYNNVQGTVTPIIDSALWTSTEKLRICSGCSDALDHSQHNVVDIAMQQVKDLMKASNTPEPIILDME